jgi:hypothetical protein
MKNFIAVAVMLVFSISVSLAQRGYTELKTVDNVKIMYSWQKATPMVNSDAALSLRATNQNDYPVKWTFSLVFYHDKKAVHESELTEVCLKPGQSLRGGLAGLRFGMEGLKLEEVNSDHFEWEIEQSTVERVENCNKR